MCMCDAPGIVCPRLNIPRELQVSLSLSLSLSHTLSLYVCMYVCA
jgi:hypothetical protein